jgi:hypothetical protein
MTAPRRIPPVQPSSGEGEDSSVSGRKEADPIGKILLQAKAVKREALDAALLTQRKTFLPLGRILRDEAGLSEEALATALKKQNKVVRVYLRFFPARRETISLLDLDFCRQHEAIAFEQLGNLLCVALNDPARRNVVRFIESQTGLEVKVFQAPWEDIQKKLANSNA